MRKREDLSGRKILAGRLQQFERDSDLFDL